MAHTQEATYSNDPENVAIDHVRLLVGDTDCKVALLTDSEIQFRLGQESSVEQAAWRACQDIVSKLTPRSHDFGAGTQRESKSQTLEHYRKLEKDLRTRGAGEFVAMRVGGISKTEKQANEQDEDIVQGHFRSEQFHNRRKGNDDPPSSIVEDFE